MFITVKTRHTQHHGTDSITRGGYMTGQTAREGGVHDGSTVDSTTRRGDMTGQAVQPEGRVQDEQEGGVLLKSILLCLCGQRLMFVNI